MFANIQNPQSSYLVQPGKAKKERQGLNHLCVIPYQKWFEMVAYGIITVIDCGWKRIFVILYNMPISKVTILMSIGDPLPP